MGNAQKMSQQVIPARSSQSHSPNALFTSDGPKQSSNEISAEVSVIRTEIGW